MPRHGQKRELYVWVGIFTIKATTEGLEIEFLIAGILLLKGTLYRGLAESRITLEFK
jgi:hypothetical protein